MEYKYKAFISYRREGIDASAAEKLQRMLEQYIVPKDFREKHARKLGYIFRDKTHIDADPDLRGILYDALDSSEYLIVMCSGKIMDPEHPWVLEEIDHFLSMHPDARDKILTILVADEPEEAIPKILYTEKTAPDGSVSRELPNYVDIRGKDPRQVLKHLRKQFFRIAATLLSCSTDGLAMRDKIRNRTKIASWIGGAAAVLAVIAGILIWSNFEINAKNQEILLRESELLTQEAQEALAENDVHTAVSNALTALPGPGNERPYYGPAEQILFSALDLFREQKTQMVPETVVLEQDTPVRELCISADGGLLTTVDNNYTVICYDTTTGTQIWSRQLDQEVTYDRTQLAVCDAWNSVILMFSNTITALDQNTGEVMWTNHNINYENWFEMTDDGRYLTCMIEQSDPARLSLAYISTQDGTTLDVFPVAESEEGVSNTYNSNPMYDYDPYDISSDGRLMAGCYFEGGDDQFTRWAYYVTDLTTGQTTVIYRDWGRGYTFHALAFSDQDTTLTFCLSSSFTEAQFYLEELQIQDGTMLWSSESVETFNLPYSLTGELLKMLPCEGYTLLSHAQALFAFDSETGELLASEEFDSNIILLEQADDSCFSFVLEDGTYSIGWLDSAGLSYFSAPHPLMSLEDTRKALLWNGGYLRTGITEEGNRVLKSGTTENGCGFIASVPLDNNCQVILRRATPFSPELEETGINIENKVRQSRDCGDLSVALTLRGLNIRIDDQEQPEVLYPEELNLDESAITGIGEPLVGANGYVLLHLPCDSREPANARYAIYDTIGREWFQISVSGQPYGLGNIKPIFAVMEDNGIIRIYDIHSGAQTAAFETGLIDRSILMHQWILEDRYLSFLTMNHCLLIFDTVTGEQVYRYQDYSFSSYLNFASDPQGKRLYIWDDTESDNIGLCVDISNWTTLVQIPDMEYYDPVSDLIFRRISAAEDALAAEQLAALRLPTTEELVALGHEFLGK